jgi:hypothetical protein
MERDVNDQILQRYGCVVYWTFAVFLCACEVLIVLDHADGSTNVHAFDEEQCQASITCQCRYWSAICYLSVSVLVRYLLLVSVCIGPICVTCQLLVRYLLLVSVGIGPLFACQCRYWSDICYQAGLRLTVWIRCRTELNVLQTNSV